MKIFILSLLLFLFSTNPAKPDVIYLDPLPNSKFVSIYNNLVIGLDKTIDVSSLKNISISVIGSKSGIHNGKTELSSDGKKILFNPFVPFDLGEIVTVSLSSGITELNYNSSQFFSFSFSTEISRIQQSNEDMLRGELGENYRVPFRLDNIAPPTLTVTKSNNPSPGKIMYATFNSDPSYIVVSENNGALSYYQQTNSACYDFKRHPDGTYTYFNKLNDAFFFLDKDFQVIDTFRCGNGYLTDLHELVFTPSGNVLLMSYDPQIIDMSQIVQGGNPAATVIGLIIQEIDPSKDAVVFQWRSWDHFDILDATQLDFTMQNVDYVHGNAIEYDQDGNLLISSRHMDEITKINRSTGQIMWRLGGLNNQFTFINDALKFSYQHDIRRLENGNITLYDNGNFHSPQFSRAVEYTLDEVNKTATLVWEYINTPTIYGRAMGSAKRLPNGNTLIGWGFTPNTLTEVTPSGEIALEMNLPAGILTYRVSKSDFDIPTVLSGNQLTIPGKYEILQNYPNPFNPSTNINFSLPQQGNVSIKVYDVMGREVRTLVNGHMQAGTHNTVFDGSGLSSGVYVYKITAGEYTAIKKMVLMK